MYFYAAQDGRCKNCGGHVDRVSKERVFYKHAGYGYSWEVSSVKSGLCPICFDKLDDAARIWPAYIPPRHKVVFSEWKSNGHYVETIDIDMQREGK